MSSSVLRLGCDTDTIIFFRCGTFWNFRSGRRICKCLQVATIRLQDTLLFCRSSLSLSNYYSCYYCLCLRFTLKSLPPFFILPSLQYQRAQSVSFPCFKRKQYLVHLTSTFPILVKQSHKHQYQYPYYPPLNLKFLGDQVTPKNHPLPSTSSHNPVPVPRKSHTLPSHNSTVPRYLHKSPHLFDAVPITPASRKNEEQSSNSFARVLAAVRFRSTRERSIGR